MFINRLIRFFPSFLISHQQRRSDTEDQRAGEPHDGARELLILQGR
jgi:hypothetical protein